MFDLVAPFFLYMVRNLYNGFKYRAVTVNITDHETKQIYLYMIASYRENQDKT